MSHIHITENYSSFTSEELIEQVKKLKQFNTYLEEELADTRQQLEKQQSFADFIIENGMVGYWQIHLLTGQLYISKGLKKMLGYEKEPASDQLSFWKKAIHPEDLPLLRKKYEHHIVQHETFPFDHETRFFHKNGYLVDIYCWGKIAEWTEDNQPVRILGVCIDISKLKQAERAVIATNHEYEELHKAQVQQAEELKKAIKYQKDIIFTLERKERKLREIQQLTGVGYFISYFKPRHTVWSPEIYTQFGIDPAEQPPLGEAYWKMIHPDDVAIAKAAIEQAMAQGAATYEQRVIREDGTMVYLRCTLRPWQNENGKVAGIHGGSLDITDIKTAQEETARSVVLQKAIFNNSLDALFLVDPYNDSVLECNDRAIQLFEAGSKENLLGTHSNQFQKHPFSPDETREIYTKFTAQGKGSWSSEVECITRKGQSFWGNIAVTGLEIGSIRLALVRVTDITDRIKLKELLSEAQEMATIGGWEYDLKSQKVTWTDEMYRMYGLPAEHEVNIEQTLACFVPEHQEQLRKGMATLIRQGGTYEFETEMMNIRQQRLWVKIIAKAHQEKDKTTKISGTIQDIDEQKRQELSLRSRQSELQAFVEAAPAAIAMFDKNMYYIAASEKWYEEYQLLDQKILGKCHEHLVSNMPAAWREGFQRALQGTVQRREEDRYENEDGTALWLKWEMRPWHDSIGEIGGIIMLTEDITERKKQEEELMLAKQKAEEASHAKALFLSTMSHEIRTPMNAVIGMTHILLQDELKPEQYENLQVLRFSAENLLALINDILDFSKIEAGKIELEQADFSIRDMVFGIKKSLMFKAEEKGLKLKMLLDEDTPQVAVGDPTRLSQILINLISNAIKFTDKGSVTVVVEVNARKNDTVSLRFGVKDTGIGIPPDKIQTIFESFTQADTFTTRKYGGTGLGLAITKRLLEIHGSRIQVESTPGQGSHFYFDITYKVNENSQAPIMRSMDTTQVTFESLQGYKILLVEDNTMNVLVAKRFLNKWELPFDHAENGRVAVELAARHAYDLILMDLQMPEMDGYEATFQIKASGIDTPIIALTASAMMEIQEKILQSGMCDFVTKPFNPNELYLKIKRYLYRK